MAKGIKTYQRLNLLAIFLSSMASRISNKVQNQKTLRIGQIKNPPDKLNKKKETSKNPKNKINPLRKPRSKRSIKIFQ